MRSLDLNRILAPYSVAEFLTEYFGVKVLHAAGNPQRYAPLLSWDGIIEEWKTGTQIVIEKLDQTHLPVMALARNLERTLETPVRANLHAGSGGFPLHREECDVILLQIAGHSQWSVHGQAEEQPSEQPTWEARVEEGDALYIPRGTWHTAAPSGHPTLHLLHLAIYVDNPTGSDLLDWFVRHLKQQKCFQTDVPRFSDPADRVNYLATLRRTTALAWRTPGLLERFARHRNAHALPRPLLGVPWSPTLPDETVIAMAAPRHLQILRSDKGVLYLACNGRHFTFPEDAVPLLQFLCDHAPVSISKFQESLLDEFDREEILEFLAVLARDGIISLHAPDSIY